MTTEIDIADLNDALAERGRIIVLDLFDDRCTPCLTQEHFTDIAALGLHSKAEVYRMNLVQDPLFAPRHGVSELPAVAIFKDGRLRHLFPGLTDPGSISAAADALARET
jgi:thioredoxin-like negative regulator of GroEL